MANAEEHGEADFKRDDKNGADTTQLENGQAPEPEKKKRGKPKDPLAPPKPKSGYQQFAGEARERLKQERPELLSDLSGMGKAIAEEWQKVPDGKKAVLQEQYEKEMAIWSQSGLHTNSLLVTKSSLKLKLIGLTLAPAKNFKKK